TPISRDTNISSRFPFFFAGSVVSSNIRQFLQRFVSNDHEMSDVNLIWASRQSFVHQLTTISIPVFSCELINIQQLSRHPRVSHSTFPWALPSEEICMSNPGSGRWLRFLLIVMSAVTLSALLGCGNDSSSNGVVPPSGTNNSLLQGQYAFEFAGQNSGGFLTAVGSFTADGQGNISAGLEDVNNGF